MSEEQCIVWRVLWSYNGYRGFDEKMFDKWLAKDPEVLGIGYEYFRDYGFGSEWWNFYEGFRDDQYVGYAPPAHRVRPTIKRPKAIVFVARSPRDGKWYVVGFYGNPQILDEAVELNLWRTLSPEDEETVKKSEKTVRELQGVSEIGYITAPKELSFSLSPSEYLVIDDPFIELGTSLKGRGDFRYINCEYVASLLAKARERVRNPELKDKIARIMDRLFPGVSIQVPIQRVEEKELALQPPEKLLRRLVEDALDKLGELIGVGNLELIGTEYTIKDVGRADIVARDENDQVRVVIEVKAGEVNDITQILAYMRGLEAIEPGKKVIGVLLGSSFDKKVMIIARNIPELKLIKYSLGIELSHA